MSMQQPMFSWIPESWVENSIDGSKLWSCFDVSADGTFFAGGTNGGTTATGTCYLLNSIGTITSTHYTSIIYTRECYLFNDNGLCILYNVTGPSGIAKTPTISRGANAKAYNIAKTSKTGYMGFASNSQIARELSPSGYGLFSASPTDLHKSLAASFDGVNIYSVSDTALYYSNNSGAAWGSGTGLTGTPVDICCSSTGQYVLVVCSTGQVLYSTDYGHTYTALTSFPSYTWLGCKISNDGTVLLLWSATKILRSSNSGATSVDITFSQVTNIVACGLSQDGLTVITGNNPGYIYIKTFSP
jgi:hypothetical protein